MWLAVFNEWKLTMSFKKILVVCVGNICRSPIGEALLRKQHPNLIVNSAGLSALVGEGADDKAIQVMDEWNVDIRNHRAQQLTQELMQTFDLVLCMSKDQENWMKQNYSSQRGKVYRIGHWINENVADPYKLPIEKFYESRELLNKAVESWKDKLA